MLGGELAVEGDALALEVGDGLERRLEIARHLRAERGRLLDGGVLGKDEEVGAGRRAFGDPACDLVPPRVLRGGLVDRVLRGGNLERLARHHDYLSGLAGVDPAGLTPIWVAEVSDGFDARSALIQNCIGWSVSSGLVDVLPGVGGDEARRRGHSRASSKSRRAGGSPRASTGGRRGARRGRRSSA